MASAPSRPNLRWQWLLAAALMLGEFLLFDRMTSRHHTGIYPRWNDQIQYITEAYTAYQHSLDAGILGGLKAALTKSSLQGTLHDFAAVLVFHVAGGPSRSAALSLNMLAFLAWQAAVLAGVKRLTGSRTLAWLSFGLLPCLAWPWTADAGSAVDFRLDHAAMCLLGITAMVSVQTRGFRDRGWSLALGVCIGVTILERFITGVYFTAIFLACLPWVLLTGDRAARLRHLLLAGVVATLLAAPLLWYNRQGIYTYYWVGHVSGAEGEVRAQGMTAWESARFICGRLLDMQLGTCFLAYAGVAALLLAALLPRRRASAVPPLAPGWLFSALVFLLGPALVLGLHRQKSAYVLGALAPGAVLLVLWVWAQLWRRAAPAADHGWRRIALVILAVAGTAAGELYFVHRQLQDPYTPEFHASAREVNRIADYIYEASRIGGITHPNIAVDQVVDFVDAPILQVMCFERKKVWIPFVVQLPNSILEEKDESIRYKVGICDFVLLTDRMPGDGYWPYDKQMRRLYPELKAWCEAHLRMAGHYQLFGRDLTLYQRTVLP